MTDNVEDGWLHFNIPESEYEAAKDWLENQSKGSYVMDRSKLCPDEGILLDPTWGTLHKVYFSVFLQDEQRDAVLFKLFFADHLISDEDIVKEREQRGKWITAITAKVYSSGKTNMMTNFMSKGRGLREGAPVLIYDHEASFDPKYFPK